MAWFPFNYVTDIIARNVDEGDLISIDFASAMPELYDIRKGPIQSLVPIVTVVGPTVWKNMVTEIERDIAVVIPTINGIRKSPIYQEYRSQCYGPYMTNKGTLGVSFIYPDVIDGISNVTSTTADMSDSDNTEGVFPPPDVKVNESGSDHIPLQVDGLGFLVGARINDDIQIETLQFVKRLVIKHKSYIGSACDIVTGIDIIALKGAANIRMDALILY